MLRCSTNLRSGITRSNATKLPTLSQQPRTSSLSLTLRSRHLEPRTRAIYTFSHALSPPESASTAESKLGLESKPRLIQRQTLLSLSSQTLVALSRFSQVSQLGLASSATDQTLALNLASPHPGAGDVIEAAAKWTAKEVGADVLELDYLEVVKMVEELGEKKGKDTAIPQLQPSAITASTPFSPALYTPQKDIQSSSTFDDDFDDDEDFDEDEVDETPSPRGSARAIFGGLIRDSNAITHHHHHHQTFPVSVRVVVDGKDSVVMSDNSNTSSSVSTDAPPSPTLSAKSLSTGRAGRVRVQVDRPLSPSSTSPKVSSSTDIWNPKNFSSPDMNFYNVDLRASHIDRVMNSLLETIIKNVNSSSTSRKRVIIIYKDVTDTLEHGKESGKRVLAGLLNLVKTARETHNINIVLHALCTSSLLSKPSAATSESDSLAQFTPFDNTHFTRLFAEKVVQTSDSSQSAEPFSLLQSTHLYKTVLDQLPHLFEKVEVPPTFITPAPLPASSSNDTQQSSIEISPEYLQETANSLTSRHISLNLRQLHLHAASRNLKLNLPPLSTFTNQEEAPQDRTLLPEDLLPLTKTLLGHSIWPLDRIRRLVGIAMGSQLLTNASLDRPIEGTLEIGVAHVTEALKVIQSETWGTLVTTATRLAAEKVLDVTEDGSVSAKKDDGDDGGVAAGLILNEPVQTSVKETVVPKAPILTSVPETAETAATRLKQMLKRQGHKLNSYETKMLSTVVTPSSIQVGFNDLILPPPTKLMLQTLVTLPLLRPDLFQTGILAKHSIAGVLLFGPPGTGKTMLAKAAAKSSGANFMSVSLSDIFDKYVGEGEKNVRAIFTLARKLAPCIVFLDEVDALFGTRRSSETSSSKREIINEFMTEWDGLTSSNKSITILGATNRPFDLDDAILRRMPRRVLIDLPTPAQRLAILKSHLKDDILSPTLSLDAIVEKTPLYSGSDLKNLCIAASLTSVKEHILRTSLPTSSTSEILSKMNEIEDWNTIPTTAGVAATSVVERVLTQEHFEQALKEVPPSLTDEMQTLVELRKWDEMYGDGGGKGKKKNVKAGWGFTPAPPLKK